MPRLANHAALPTVLPIRVPMGTNDIIAFVSSSVLQAWLGPRWGPDQEFSLDEEDRLQLDEAVRRRVHGGARLPVVLRAEDLA